MLLLMSYDLCEGHVPCGQLNDGRLCCIKCEVCFSFCIGEQMYIHRLLVEVACNDVQAERNCVALPLPPMTVVLVSERKML